MHGPPSYMDLLEKIFEGVAVDGSTSYVAGQANMDANWDNEEGDKAYEIPEYESSMSSGSQEDQEPNCANIQRFPCPQQ